jgi:hypothetical protein
VIEDFNAPLGGFGGIKDKLQKIQYKINNKRK